eukprot:3493656-Pyramimonas_sp.AAC.1
MEGEWEFLPRRGAAPGVDTLTFVGAGWAHDSQCMASHELFSFGYYRSEVLNQHLNESCIRLASDTRQEYFRM